MTGYPFSVDIVRLTIILGLVISTLIYKRTGNTMGGILIPGYLALYFTQPLHIFSTLLIASLTYYIVHQRLKKIYMLNGRRLFEVEILMALILQITFSAILTLLGGTNSSWALLYGIGFVIPGLIAHEIGRQGLVKTLTTTLFGTLLVFVIITPLAAVERTLPDSWTLINISPLLRAQPFSYAYAIGLLPIAIVISVMVDMLLYRTFKIRPGGFVTAAYFALFYTRPWDLLFVLVSTLVTFFLVRFLAEHLVLVFGRVRFGLIILISVVISWLFEIAIINITGGQFVPWSGFVIIMPMLVALLANSIDIQGLPPTMLSLATNSAIVWVIMMGIVLILDKLNLYYYFNM